MTGPRFAALPSPCLVDETLHIRLQGVAPGCTVTLRLAGAAPGDQAMLSQALFVAAGGEIDLMRDAPAAGSYRGADPMGLFWSGRAVPRSRVPSWMPLDADPLVLTLAAEVQGEAARPLLPVRRTFAAGTVSRELREAGLVGRFCVPAAAGRHPAVLVVGGSRGRMDWAAEAASLLASRGFAALALAYFGMEGLPATLDRIPLEYFGRALEWLAAQPEVAPERIATYGHSRGGELALLLGATFPAIRAVVASAPSGIVHPAYPASGHAAWTWQGREVPGSDVVSRKAKAALFTLGRVRAGGLGGDQPSLQDEASARAHAIPVERIHGPVLFIVGEDDRIWPCATLAGFALGRLREHRFAHRVELLSYPGAGHFLGWPNVPPVTTHFRHPVSGEVVDPGGSPEATARACQDAWTRMLAFLRDSLAR